jgi:hypothetical protein
MDAVGDAGGGGGGGVGGATFFLQAPSISTALRAITVASVFTLGSVRFFFISILFTFDSSCEPEQPVRVQTKCICILENSFISNSSSVASYVP